MLCRAATTSGVAGTRAVIQAPARFIRSQSASGRRGGPIAVQSALRRRSALQGYVFSAALGLWSMSRGASSAAAANSPASEIEKVLQDPGWPAKFPFKASDFARYDESPDAVFYSQPRFVTHIDDAAIAALTRYYEAVFPKSGQQDVAILDLCSSWVSHYPPGYQAGRISALGMNEAELARNPVATDYVVRDLNRDPTLPYADECFDVVTNAVSVDYLSRPLEVFREISRVLKPGGLAIMSFSNRCFPTKAISIWTATGDPDHIWIVGSYFHYAGGFDAPEARDITASAGRMGARTDPMYVVYATKQKAA